MRIFPRKVGRDFLNFGLKNLGTLLFTPMVVLTTFINKGVNSVNKVLTAFHFVFSEMRKCARRALFLKELRNIVSVSGLGDNVIKEKNFHD